RPPHNGTTICWSVDHPTCHNAQLGIQRRVWAGTSHWVQGQLTRMGSASFPVILLAFATRSKWQALLLSADRGNTVIPSSSNALYLALAILPGSTITAPPSGRATTL